MATGTPPLCFVAPIGGAGGQRTLISRLLGSTPDKLLHIPHRPVVVVRGRGPAIPCNES